MGMYLLSFAVGGIMLLIPFKRCGVRSLYEIDLKI